MRSQKPRRQPVRRAAKGYSAEGPGKLRPVSYTCPLPTVVTPNLCIEHTSKEDPGGMQATEVLHRLRMIQSRRA